MRAYLCRDVCRQPIPQGVGTVLKPPERLELITVPLCPRVAVQPPESPVLLDETDGDACVLAAACVIRQITFEVQLVADAPTELLILGAHVFQQLTAENIHVECCMYRLATERFSDVMWAMQQLLFTSFDKRLAQYLWDESDHARAPVRATHEQIARDTGAVRETVTRMLRHFADDGIVSLGRGTVTVTDAEKLRKLAGM